MTRFIFITGGVVSSLKSSQVMRRLWLSGCDGDAMFGPNLLLSGPPNGSI